MQRRMAGGTGIAGRGLKREEHETLRKPGVVMRGKRKLRRLKLQRIWETGARMKRDPPLVATNHKGGTRQAQNFAGDRAGGSELPLLQIYKKMKKNFSANNLRGFPRRNAKISPPDA